MLRLAEIFFLTGHITLMFLFLFISLFLLGFVGADDCPPMWVKYQSKCYLFTTNQLSYAQCSSACPVYQAGATMLCIENMDQNIFIQNSLPVNDPNSYPKYFLGYSRNANGQFVWFSGCESTFTNWVPGQPDNQGGQEYYGEMGYYNGVGSVGQWNDMWEYLHAYCACELSDLQPSGQPSGQPSIQPSRQPTQQPSQQPSPTVNTTMASPAAHLISPMIEPTPTRSKLPPSAELYDRANFPATRRQQSAASTGSYGTTRNTQSGDEVKSKINKMREKVAAMRDEL